MIETIARNLHEADPTRPVITALEDGGRLPSELTALRQWAPSVDIIGINARNEQRLHELPALVHALDSTRPFLVSEFGAREYRDTINGAFPREDNDTRKAASYSRAWNDVIVTNKGSNLGGVAFCWKDRFEGSATWFGITDYRGRRKAAYYALQKAWLGQAHAPAIPRLFLVGPECALETGRQYEFTAVYNGTEAKKTEWHLYREDKIHELGSLKGYGQANKIWISLPDQNARYRLYVYVDDGLGNVATASVPVVPYNGIYNKAL